jgi:outer membrane protein TolC
MNLRRIAVALLLAAPLALAGCAAGYRSALKDWQRNAPSDYVAQTLDWTARAESGATNAPQKPRAGQSPFAASDLQRPTTSTETVALEVASSVMGRPAAELAPKLAAMSNPATLDRRMADGVSWRELEVAIAAANPGVRAAGKRWRAMLEQFMQGDYLDALITRYASLTRSIDVGGADTMKMNRPMTREFFPLGGPVSLRGEMAAQEAKMARLDWEMALRDALADAGNAFFDYQYLNRAIATAVENVALADDLASVVTAQARSGTAGQADLLKMQTELERRRAMLEDLRDKRRAAVAGLNAALGRNADAPLGAPDGADLPDADIPDAEWTRRALAGRQEVAEQRVKVERARLALRLGEILSRPSASQGYSVLERGMMPDSPAGMPMASFGGQRKAPDQPGYGVDAAYLAEMRRMLDAERDALVQVELQTRAMTTGWLADRAMARRALRLAGQVAVPQSRSAYAITRSAYASGKAPFLDLLDSERGLTDARLELDGARRDLNQALLKQAGVTGRLP